MMRATQMFLVVVALCLLSPAPAAARPGNRPGRRISRPQPEELLPLPEGVVVVPLPERHTVEVPAVTDVGTGPEPESEAIAPAATCGAYTETDIRPLRTQWNSGNGYCGEMSLQLAAMTRGVYISQKESRRLGVLRGADHPDLLFDDRQSASGVYGVAKMLGLYQPPESYWSVENMTRSAAKQLTPQPSSFAAWVKKNVLAGRPVIGGFRVSGGGYEDYDHIMPVYGICHSNAAQLNGGDVFVFTDNYQSELRHTPADRYFYASYGSCGYTGCIPNDYWDLGVAVGPLNVPSNLYYPVKLTISSWSDGSSVNGEPGERRATTATASYTAAVSDLTVGATYRLYRTTGLFAGNTIPQSAADLAATCAAQGANCRSITFTATAPSMTFSQASKGTPAAAAELGQFGASSISYFLVVRA